MKTKVLASVALILVACSKTGTVTTPEPEPSKMKPAAMTAPDAPTHAVVGTEPGGVGFGTKLVPKPGNELAA
ncbi:MAG TPA: hypothetical protein VF103_02925, partial [Polyangiaceae bacterium]